MRRVIVALFACIALTAASVSLLFRRDAEREAQ